MAQISVIVPVYKVEPYLRRCVDSILNQTFSDFQLILVDDGSPDSCGDICEEYAAKDSRVHVIHQQNGGLSAARNTGMDWAFANSDSQWLTFIDSDDWVHPRALELLYQAAQEKNVRISVCGYEETFDQTPFIPEESLAVSLRTPKDFYLNKLVNATVAWGKLYHRSCFETIRYPVGKLHEDEFVTYRLLFAQETIAVMAAPLYAYFVNPQGITRKAWSPRRLHAWQAYEEQIPFFDALGDEDLIRHRFREYLQNAETTLKTVEQAPNADELKPILRKMEKHLRGLVRRAWKRGYIYFWIDFEFLYRLDPVGTKLYRFYLEHRK